MIGRNPPDYMLDPPDDVEEGEAVFDESEPMTQAEKDEEAAFWANRVNSSGRAAADFMYDPLSRGGFE